MIGDDDLRFLRRCVELAAEALEAGDQPFGSVLVSASGEVLAEDRNRDVTGDPTHHPELALARWAAAHLEPQERATATVYTSGEHCAMCSAGHAWAGLGRIVYASSGEQLSAWMRELGIASFPIVSFPINAIAPDVPVDGPVPELADQVHALLRRRYAG